MTIERSQRLASLLRDEINEMLRGAVKDPRLEGVAVTRIELAKDCRFARVRYTCLGDQSGAPEAQQAFERATGFIRGHLGRHLRIRVVPELRFEHDDVLHKATEVRLLIDEVVRQDDECKRARGELEGETTSSDPDEEPGRFQGGT